MPRLIEEPVVTAPNDILHDTITTHPAYAQIVASRITGGSMLYGSDFQHQNYITISVRPSELVRHLSNDRYYANALPLIEVKLSEAQWATFVSSMNIGFGVPCTLSHYGEKEIPGLPFPKSKKKTFTDEVESKAQKALDRMDILAEEIEQLKLSSKIKQQLLSKLEDIRTPLTSSIPFILGQFAEHMEESVEKAKIEINAYGTQMLMQTGLSALQGPQLQLVISDV